MFHLAWFGGTGPNHWDGPSQAVYDWRQPDIYQDVARLCERADNPTDPANLKLQVQANATWWGDNIDRAQDRWLDALS
jgi:hypothetical protein